MRCARWILGPAILALGACDYPPLARLGSDGGGMAGGGACNRSADCTSAERPVCDLATAGGTCVACTPSEHGACGGTTPRCEDDQCVACVDDGDCPGSVCLPSGACADAATIIHAAATAGLTTPGCGQRPPSGPGPCTLETALSNARGSGSTVVILLDDAAPYLPDGLRFVVDADVTLDLRVGATITSRSDSAVLTVNSGKLAVLGGTISGGSGSAGDGIACNTGALIADRVHITANAASAINATSCAVTVTRAQIDNNNPTGPLTSAIRVSRGSITLARSTIQGNRGGGLDINSAATFAVVGNVFVGNGDPAANLGGIAISTTASGNRLEFNSVAENKAQAGAGAGVACVANAGFTAANNIVWNNRSGSAAGPQVLGNCGHAYSDIGPTAIASGIPTSNLQNVDPSFVNAPTDLHLSASSPLGMLQADPQASLAGIAALDIDGQVRSAPATMGADQPSTR